MESLHGWSSWRVSLEVSSEDLLGGSRVSLDVLRGVSQGVFLEDLLEGSRVSVEGLLRGCLDKGMLCGGNTVIMCGTCEKVVFVGCTPALKGGH